MEDFDPGVIRRAAARMRRRAALAPATSAVLGVLIGLLAGPTLMQSLPPAVSLRVPDWAVAALLGGLGLLQGLERAAQLRLQAQAALCQLRIEENTRHAAGHRGATPGGQGPVTS